MLENFVTFDSISITKQFTCNIVKFLLAETFIRKTLNKNSRELKNLYVLHIFQFREGNYSRKKCFQH